MKKLLFTLFFLTASCLMLLTACTECEVCSFGDWKTVTEATCTAEGEKVRTCSECGKEDRQPIEKKDHDLSLKETILAATCTSEGKEKISCKNCNYMEERTKNATGHNAPPATCTNASICKNCGVKLQDAGSHNYTAATCTNPKTCSSCGEKDGQALGHSTKLGKCSRCGSFRLENANRITELQSEILTAMKSSHATFQTITSQSSVDKMCRVLEKCFRYLSEVSNKSAMLCQTISGISEYKDTYNAFSEIANIGTIIQNEFANTEIVAGNMKYYAQYYTDLYATIVKKLNVAADVIVAETKEIQTRYGNG